MSESQQKMKNIRSGAGVSQTSEVAKTQQDMDDVFAKEAVEQRITAGNNQVAFEELQQLLQQLKEVLASIPDEQSTDIVKAAKRANAIEEEIKKETPDKEKLEINGDSLLLAAKNLASVVPFVLSIATQVVKTIGLFM